MPLIDLPPPPHLDAAWEPPALHAPRPDGPVLPEPPDLRAEDDGSGWEPPDTDAFLPGDLDVSLRLSMAGWDWTPASLLTSLIGWVEFQAVVDYGVRPIEDVTLGLGLQLHYTRPGLLKLISQGFLNVGSEERIRWRAVDRGASARLSLAYNQLETLTPYGLITAGPSLFDLTVLQGRPTAAEGTYRTGTLRIAAGGGVNAGWENGMIGGVELRYQVAPKLAPRDTIRLRDEEGVVVQTFDIPGYQNPPKGFAWGFYLGYRL